MELKFQEFQKLHGSDRGDFCDSELARVCQQCHMSVMGHNSRVDLKARVGVEDKSN